MKQYKLNLMEGLHLFMLCKQSIVAIEKAIENYKQNVDVETNASKIVDTFKMFESLLKYKENNENLIGDLFREVFYKDMDTVLKGMMNNPNVVSILSSAPYVSNDEGYNLFVTVGSRIRKHIDNLANDLKDNLYLSVSYDMFVNYNYNNNKLDKIKMSDSYPEMYAKTDKNFEILSDLFKAKLNSLNKNNILETLRMLVGGNTIQEVGDIFNVNADIKLVLLDLIEKMAGAIADNNLFNKLIKTRAAKIVLDSTNDLLTNIQKESAGILINIENQVNDTLALGDETICEFDNAVMDTGEVYSITLKSKLNFLTKDDIEQEEKYNCYQYGLIINNHLSNASESEYVISKDNIELIPEESLLVIAGYMIISLFKTINDSANYDINTSFISNAIDNSRSIMYKVENKILKDFPAPEDSKRLEEILTVNFKNRFNLDVKLDRISLFRNTISNEDITDLAKIINLFIESLNN